MTGEPGVVIMLYSEVEINAGKEGIHAAVSLGMLNLCILNIFLLLNILELLSSVHRDYDSVLKKMYINTAGLFLHLLFVC